MTSVRTRPHPASSDGRLRALSALLTLALATSCGGGDAPSQTPGGEEAATGGGEAFPLRTASLRSRAAPDAADITLLGYNVLYEYRQTPRANGSFSPWVCRGYPHVIDHPEFRWEQRRRGVFDLLEQEDADVLGLTEIRGGYEVPVEGGPAPAPPSYVGAPIITEMTGWLRDHGYRWVSVDTVDPASLEADPTSAQGWPGEACGDDSSENGCRSWDPRTDQFSTRGYVAYRASRFELVDSGAVETPTANLRERRFAPWARLRDRASGLELVVGVAHLDPKSGPHRVEGARRLRALSARMSPTPTALLGDYNTLPETAPDCSCCAGCDCSAIVCEGASPYAVLTGEDGPGPRLQDTLLVAPNAQTRGTVVLITHPPGVPRWSSEETCWRRSDAAPGREHVGAVAAVPSERRVDYVFASTALEVLDAAVIEPTAPAVSVDGQSRTVTPSDHLPVRATVRVRRPAN
ncbi:MAG: endonuclease/exonuclease/phosphatase family protein [Sandaracinaceae bacterium]